MNIQSTTNIHTTTHNVVKSITKNGCSKDELFRLLSMPIEKRPGCKKGIRRMSMGSYKNEMC